MIIQVLAVWYDGDDSCFEKDSWSVHSRNIHPYLSDPLEFFPRRGFKIHNNFLMGIEDLLFLAQKFQWKWFWSASFSIQCPPQFSQILSMRQGLLRSMTQGYIDIKRSQFGPKSSLPKFGFNLVKHHMLAVWIPRKYLHSFSFIRTIL